MQKIILFDLHFFDGEQAGGAVSTGNTGSTAAPTTAAAPTAEANTGANTGDAAPIGRKNGNPLANVRYGIQPQEQQPSTAAPVNQSATGTEAQGQEAPKSFEELIKGEYKKDFDERVQKIVQSRLKGAKETQTRLEAMSPLLDLVANRYGIGTDDSGNYNVNDLVAALENDTNLYESEAMEQGIPVETYMSIQRMQRENARYQREEAARKQEAENREKYYKLMQECEAIKQKYPSFDLETEMQNETFGKLVALGTPGMTAYEVVHRDEIMSSAMQYAVQRSAAQVAESIAAGASRPAENGISAQAAIVTRTDPRALTKEDRAEIRRRVARGEKISF